MIDEINKLKKELDLVILAHYYMSSDIQKKEEEGGIADFVGDSLGLSLEAAKTQASGILFCGVKFMAETAVITNPLKKVYLPDQEAGCSLASSITAADVRELKKKYPGIPVMGYINTNAETKTELDVCCTSRNAVKIASSLESDKILFVPDYFMGQNLQKQIGEKLGKELILWTGTCEVHEQFNLNLLNEQKEDDVEYLFHWEVPAESTTEVLQSRKGIIGSTGDILNYVKESRATKFYLASECDLGVALKNQNRDKEFITPCITCRFMKMITLDKIYQTLLAIKEGRGETYQVTLSEEVIEKAAKPVERMLALS